MSLKTRIERIESTFGKQAIYPPESIIPYLKDEKVFRTESEKQWYGETTNNWFNSALESLKRGDATLQEFVDGLPEPFRTKLLDEFRQQLKQEKEESIES